MVMASILCKKKKTRFLTYIVMILSTFAISQAQEHLWQQSSMAEPGMPKQLENVNLSSGCFQG